MMSRSFDANPFPDRPKILFIGLGESSHTHSWIDLLEGAPFNVRLFALPSGLPPPDWDVKTYVTAYYHPRLNPENRLALHSVNRTVRFIKRQVARASGKPMETIESAWLAEVIHDWRPDIIHTLGIDSAGEFYFASREKYRLDAVGKWVLQTRGGSDMALTHLDPHRRERIAELVRECDQLISDNQQNFRIARSMGATEDQVSRIGTVPGTGGIDIDRLQESSATKPSDRKLILWPKTYETPWAKVLPVFEAIQLCWKRLPACEIVMLSMDAEARMWYWTLPATIREKCHPHGRVPRAEVLKMMAEARVMLAPSLVDGVPNSMFEAMAAGAFPIVSPLETIRPVVENERNVLFARNLYPHEIAEAIVRAMTDDDLIDAAAERNLALVRRVANRAEIRGRVIEFYETLA